jgi:hypothetical protein
VQAPQAPRVSFVLARQSTLLGDRELYLLDFAFGTQPILTL